MKRKVFLFVLAAAVAVLLSSCSNIPTFSGGIPEDPEGVSEPTSWGNDVQMALSIDKTLSLTPLTLQDYNRIKLSFLGYTPPDDVNEDNVKVFEDGKAQGFLLEKVSRVRNKVDIVFIVDVTGSMGEEINGVKSSMINFINDLESSGLDAKVAIVPYDDYVPTKDYTYSPSWLDLSNLSDASSYVGDLIAAGGGDFPENAYGAIMYAWNNVSWRSDSQRIFILLTDAFSHYKGDSGWVDSTNNFSPEFTKNEIISALSGYATLYMVASIDPYYGDYYHKGDSNFSHPGDPREIAIRTGGFVIYQSGSEEVDLSSIGLTEAITSSYIITFESDSPVGTHTISVYYEGSDGKQSYKEIQMNY